MHNLITDREASRIILQMMDDSVEGAGVLATYVDQRSTITEWTERQLVDAALKRSDECARLCQNALERLARLEKLLAGL